MLGSLAQENLFLASLPAKMIEGQVDFFGANGKGVIYVTTEFERDSTIVVSPPAIILL